MKVVQNGDEIRCTIEFNPYEEVRRAFDEQLRKIEERALADELKAHGFVYERECECIESEMTYKNWAVTLHNHRFTCGHNLEWLHSDPPAYCPVCGAKVVEQ